MRGSLSWYRANYGHMAQDQMRRDRNKDEGKDLCARCEGTGNELLSMYRRCGACGGTGVAPAGSSSAPDPAPLAHYVAREDGTVDLTRHGREQGLPEDFPS